MHRFDVHRLAADADLVRSPPVLPPRQAEHFARCRQVAEHDAVERDDRDQVRPSPVRSVVA